MKKKFKPNTKKILNEVKYTKTAAVLFVLNLILAVFVFLLNKRLPPELPILYGYSEGEKQLVSSRELVLPFVASGLIVVLNFIVTLLSKNKFVRLVLIATSFIAVIFSIVTVYKVISVVGNF